MAGAELQPPGGDGLAHALGQAMMALEDLLQPLALQQIERSAQAAQQGGRRGIGEIAVLVGAGHVGEIEIAAEGFGLGGRGHRLRGDGHDGEARGQHEALLRAGDRQIDAPFVHAEIDAGDGADAIDIEQGRMAGGIQRPAQRRDIAGDAGRRLVMADQHRLDAMGLVGGEALGIGLDRRPLAPFALDRVHLEAEAPAHLDPEMGELAEAGGEHAVAGR